MQNDFKKDFINLSKEIGFLDVGFAKFQKLEKEIENYKCWLSKNYNAKMQWMERNLEKREDVSLILPNCKTVIVFLYNYFSNPDYPSDEILINNAGKISRYALGEDYHDIVLGKLNQIEKFIINHFPNSSTKSYVDTGPILEKIWAVKSGIVWQGKNSLAISKKHGSYFFIGIILTDLEIESDDKQLKDYCGTCNKCKTACPTNAIVAPQIVDSNLCIAYNTIELKPQFEIAENVAQNLQNWVYGCDICQEVCPWNKNLTKLTDEIRFLNKDNISTISIQKINELSKEEFKQFYKNSPISRTKSEGIKRNFNALEKYWKKINDHQE